MDVHFFLEEERLRIRKTQEEMAEIGGVKLRTYANYASGDRVPDASFLASIAAAGADVQYILTGERSGNALAPEEQELISYWRAAPLAVKAAAIGALQGGSAQANSQSAVVTGNKNSVNQTQGGASGKQGRKAGHTD